MLSERGSGIGGESSPTPRTKSTAGGRPRQRRCTFRPGRAPRPPAGFDNRGCTVSVFDELDLAAPVGAVLESLGWAATDAAVRDAVPTALRGHPVAALVPPAGRWAAPAMAAALSRLAPGEGLQALVLAPTALTA